MSLLNKNNQMSQRPLNKTNITHNTATLGLNNTQKEQK